MDQELKHYLEAMEARVNGRFDALEARVNGQFEALEARVNARIEKAETNLLTAFHGWARSMEIRLRGISATVSGYDERLALVEERISQLERKTAS